MFILFIFFTLLVWFIRLAMIAADDFVGILSTKRIILAVIEITVFFIIVFYTVSNRLSIEQSIQKYYAELSTRKCSNEGEPIEQEGKIINSIERNLQLIKQIVREN